MWDSRTLGWWPRRGASEPDRPQPVLPSTNCARSNSAAWSVPSPQAPEFHIKLLAAELVQQREGVADRRRDVLEPDVLVVRVRGAARLDGVVRRREAGHADVPLERMDDGK